MNQVKFAKIITEIFDLESKKEYLSILKLLDKHQLDVMMHMGGIYRPIRRYAVLPSLDDFKNEK